MSATETGTSLVQRTQQVVSQIQDPVFLEQVEALLPDTVPLRRFVQVAKTAIRTNPDLVNADQTSLFGAIVQCAQEGLVPDNREAALVPYKGKVQYIKMIGGVRKIAAEYGWMLRTRVVYSNDEFDWSEEPQSITHKPARGGERGDRMYAYAIAEHRDGRRAQRVLDAEQIAKRRAKAQTQKVWDEHPDPMWEKSAGHALFDEIPRSELDQELVRRLIDQAQATEAAFADPVSALYGPNGETFTASEIPRTASPAPRESQQAEAVAPPPAAASVPGDEPEDADWTPVDDDEPAGDFAAAALTKVPGGVYLGQTFAEVAETKDGPVWFLRQLKTVGAEAPARAAIETFVKGQLPDVWARYETFLAESSS